MDKDMGNVDDKLEDALAMLAAGLSVTEILADAGDDADWLRPLLETATEVGGLRAAISIPSPEASLQRMLAYGRELATTSPPVAPVQSSWSAALASLFGGGWLPRLATGLVSALFLLVLLGGTLTVLAQRSLPGEPLYSLKRAGETLRLSLTLDPDQRAQLLENYNQHRQTEVKLLLERSQVAAVDFYGQVETVTGTTLRLAGLTLQLTPETKITGNLAAGAQVKVEVLTQPPDDLVALAVTVTKPAPPAPAPLPTAMPTPTSTPSPTATATTTRVLSSDTDTLQLPTFTPTATPTEVPTNTPTLPPPPPTATQPAPAPLPPGGSNDNSNDNADDQSSDDSGSSNDNSDNDSDDEHSGSDSSGSFGSSDNSSSGDDDHSGSDSGSDDHSGSDSGSGSSGSNSGSSDDSGSGGGDDND